MTPVSPTLPPVARGLGVGLKAPASAHALTTGLLSLVVAALTWPSWSLVPQSGLDESWQFGLSWAARMGLDWGRDLVFTFGPLGYSIAPMVWQIEQVLVAGLLHILAAAVCVVSFHALLGGRRAVRWRRSLLLATIAAVVILWLGVSVTGMVPGARMAGLTVAALPLAFCVLLSPARWPIVLAGVLIGLVGHQKFSEAILVAGLLGIATLARGRLRDLALLMVVVVTTWIGTWFAIGQDLLGLPQHLASVAGVVSGYAGAMAIENPAFGWTYGPAAVAAILLLVQSRWAMSGQPPAVRIGTLAMVVWFLWISFRQGFVRHDIKDVFFFVAVLLMAVTLLAVTRNRASWMLGATTCVPSLFVLTTYGLAFGGIVQVPNALESLGRTVTSVTDARARAAWWDAAVEEALAAYALEPSLVDALSEGPTTVDPWHVTALLPTGAVWDPVPVFQLYAAYTPELDMLDARSISEHPRQILRDAPPDRLDERYPYWEAPQYQMAVYCRYAVLLEAGPWQVLRPRGSDRCRHPDTEAVVEAAAGEVIPVPTRDGAITVVSLTFHQSMLDVLSNLAFKGPERHIRYGESTWRMPLVPKTGGLMLNAPVPDRAFAGLPQRPFPTLEVDAPARVEFSFVDVAPTDAATSAPSEPRPPGGLARSELDAVVRLSALKRPATQAA